MTHRAPAPAILLPGILLPASLRYAPLAAALGSSARVFPKELEVHAHPSPTFEIADEVAGIEAFADEMGLDRFHLYGHSAGGACALAYVAAHPDRVLTLSLDEPASDFTPSCQEDPLWDEMRIVLALPAAEQLPRFLRLQLAPGVEPPPSPPGPPPPWLYRRPAGVRAFILAAMAHTVPPDRYVAFERPVRFSRGAGSNDFWRRMETRLAGLFPDFVAAFWPEASHLTTSHQIDPERVARELIELWAPSTE